MQAASNEQQSTTKRATKLKPRAGGRGVYIQSPLQIMVNEHSHSESGVSNGRDYSEHHDETNHDDGNGSHETNTTIAVWKLLFLRI